ncbi:hypothetical protein [Brevibacillus nitrificans]|uniref:hypothetical protein n=1 Tax=Brevibacillus nitrificans TaxID=651560 RepID=UPI002864808F|nr:hypothetical protein [Brevibacillus nitrificans]MDR7319728.1 hypothetical protein [Brevibacillus nitrificans]
MTIKTQDYLAAGTHSVQLTGIHDYAGLTDKKNVSTSQTLDFTVAGDDSLPNAEVSVESPEQIRINFNKVVTGFGAATAKLQTLVKGTGGAADTWKDVTDASLAAKYAVVPAFDLETVSDSEYVLELQDDWTEIYNTTGTNKNYYNDKYRLVIAKDAVTNPSNGKKNAEIILDLNYSGSKLNSPDSNSPVISGFQAVAGLIDTFNVELSEPVKLPGLDNEDTESQIQDAGTGVPTPIVEFLGKDKDGNPVTIKGAVAGYSDLDAADMNFVVTPAALQPSLQAIVDAGGDKNWTLVVRSISDDVGNTAASLTHDFVVEPGQQAADVFKVKDAAYNGVSGALNGAGDDTIVLDFTADVLYTGTVKNAVNPSNYLLDGAPLPKNTKITVSDSEAPAAGGVDVVTITLPDGTLSAKDNNVITLSKSLTSTKGTKLSGEYEISFKAVGAPVPDTTAPVVTGVANGDVKNTDVTPASADTDIATTTLTKDGSAVAGYTLGTAITADGAYVLTVTDNAGNATTVNFTIDKTAPTATVGATNNATTLDLTLAGTATNAVKVSETTTEAATVTFNSATSATITVANAGAADTETVVFKVVDAAGNEQQYTATFDGTAGTWSIS